MNQGFNKLIKNFKQVTHSDHPIPDRDWYWMLVSCAVMVTVISVASGYLFFFVDQSAELEPVDLEFRTATLDEEELREVLRYYNEREELIDRLQRGQVEIPDSPADRTEFEEQLLEVEETVENDDLPEGGLTDPAEAQGGPDPAEADLDGLIED